MELYHGPVAEMEAYLASIGYCRPTYMDLADFVVRILPKS